MRTPAVLETLPQIAVLGRSNVGKSSLLNSLFGRGNRAKASSRAGRTRHVDVFDVNNAVALVDLPGYTTKDGQVAAEWERRWSPLVHSYLERFAPNDPWGLDAKCDSAAVRDNAVAGPDARTFSGLHGLIFLCDIRWRATRNDRDMLRFATETLGLPTLLVLTKDDRIEPRGLSKRHPYLSRRKHEADKRRDPRVHEERVRLARLRRKELGWKGPHLHFAAGTGPGARRCRAHLRRYVDGLARAAVPSERHALLEAAWAGGAGRDFEVETRVEGLAREAAEALAQDAAQRARKQERRWRPGWVTS
jgi:GTP-binding protein EngB required for normal cell division